MDPEGIEFTLSFLTGQVHALFMVTQMLANALPEPARVLSVLDVMEQEGIANLEAQPIPDAAVDGLRRGFSGVRGAVEAAVAGTRWLASEQSRAQTVAAANSIMRARPSPPTALPG